jgi:hypothetical protein
MSEALRTLCSTSGRRPGSGRTGCPDSQGGGSGSWGATSARGVMWVFSTWMRPRDLISSTV